MEREGGDRETSGGWEARRHGKRDEKDEGQKKNCWTRISGEGTAKLKGRKERKERKERRERKERKAKKEGKERKEGNEEGRREGGERGGRRGGR